jgi:hypothetical protein
MVQVRVTARERERWIDAASRAELTLAELVREAVRRRLSNSLRVEQEQHSLPGSGVNT